MSSSWSVRGTLAGVGAVNAIRQCEEAHFVDALKQRNKELDLIKLSIGLSLSNDCFIFQGLLCNACTGSRLIVVC